LLFESSQITRKSYAAGALESDAGIRPTEKIPRRVSLEQGLPASALMLGLVMVYVTALAEGREVLGPVVGNVMIAVHGRQDNARGPHAPEDVVNSDCQAD